MSEHLTPIIDHLLRYVRAPERHTQALRRRAHNEDLCPAFRQKLELILDSYGRLSPIVYDTQGPRDDGTDVLIRHSESADAERPLIIGFQIKSGDDLRQRDWMQRLKAQHDDSFRKIQNLEYYFIVVCTDADVDREKIRLIESEFRTAERTRVIEPAYALTFLRLERERIDSFIARSLRSSDVVLQKAEGILDGLGSVMAAAIIIHLTVQQYVLLWSELTTESVLHSDLLRKVHAQLIASVPEDEEDSAMSYNYQDQCVEDLELLRDQLIDTDGDKITIRGDTVRPLVALALDAMVRYEYDPHDVESYLFALFGISG
jgi:hypothetical protein